MALHQTILNIKQNLLNFFAEQSLGRIRHRYDYWLCMKTSINAITFSKMFEQCEKKTPSITII